MLEFSIYKTLLAKLEALIYNVAKLITSLIVVQPENLIVEISKAQTFR